MMKKIIPLLAMLVLIMTACAPATTTGTNTPAAPGNLKTSTAEIPAGTATAELSTSPGGVDELIAMVNGFVTSGEITGNAENGLLAKLDAIKQKATDGQFSPAANEIGAFVNEVQAQSGKKITTAASTALITKAQVVAAELMAVVPMTGNEVQPTVAAMENMTKPAPLGDQLKHQIQWDAIALQVVQSVGFSTFTYDLYQLPANTTWDSTLAYYTTEAATADWGDAPGQTNEIAGGHYAVWTAADSNGSTNYFIVAQMDTSDGSFTLNIFGSK
jgi:hypothetical protein